MGLCCSSLKPSAQQQHEKDGKASSMAFSSPNTKVTSLMVADSPQPHNEVVRGYTENPPSSEATESTDEESPPGVITEVAPPRPQPPKTSQQATKKKSRANRKKKHNDTSQKGPLAAVKLEKTKGTSPESIQIHDTTNGTTDMLSNFRKLKLQADVSHQQNKRKSKLGRKKGERQDEKKKSALWSDFESIQQKVTVQYEMKTNDKASATSKRSKQSKTTTTSGKPPLTPSSKAKHTEALFDLKGSDSWYVDFKATPDAQSVRSQANLSLLSENSLEIQRQLYAEKRQVRRGGRGGPSSPARSSGNSSLMEIVQKPHRPANSVAASADYGPVRRHRRGGSSAHLQDGEDTAHRVLFAPDYVDVDDHASVVSDLADDDVDELLEEDNAVTPYDHAAIVQQRLDIEEQLRQLREPTEDEFDEQPLVPIKLDTMTSDELHNSGMTSVSLFSGELDESSTTKDAATPPPVLIETLEPKVEKTTSVPRDVQQPPPLTATDRPPRGNRVRKLTAKFSRITNAPPPRLNVASSNARLQSPSFDDDSTENTEPILHHRVVLEQQPSKAQETLLLAGRVEEHVQTVLDRYRTNSD